MARTYRNLWPQVLAWESLVRAYRKCRRRKRFKRGAYEFDFAWESNLLQLKQQLHDGTYEPGDYRHFYIYEPKRRKISAAPFRDRVVHHAIVGVLEPIYERRFIYDSYACRQGKGTHRAIRRAQQYLRKCPYFLKTDIVRFFPNVDHAIMVETLGKSIRDSRLMALLEQVIASGSGVLTDEATPSFFPGDDLFSLLRPTGLPIGNLTSQFFANVLLDPIDHFLKDELRVPGYVRYADDLICFAQSKSELRDIRAALTDRLGGIRLRLHRNKTYLAPSEGGLTFLGFRLFPSQRRLGRSAIRRFHQRRRFLQAAYQRRELGADQVRCSLRAWNAHAAHANTSALRRKLFAQCRFRRSTAIPNEQGPQSN